MAAVGGGHAAAAVITPALLNQAVAPVIGKAADIDERPASKPFFGIDRISRREIVSLQVGIGNPAISATGLCRASTNRGKEP